MGLQIRSNQAKTICIGKGDIGVVPQLVTNRLSLILQIQKDMVKHHKKYDWADWISLKDPSSCCVSIEKLSVFKVHTKKIIIQLFDLKFSVTQANGSMNFLFINIVNEQIYFV